MLSSELVKFVITQLIWLGVYFGYARKLIGLSRFSVFMLTRTLSNSENDWLNYKSTFPAFHFSNRSCRKLKTNWKKKRKTFTQAYFSFSTRGFLFPSVVARTGRAICFQRKALQVFLGWYKRYVACVCRAISETWRNASMVQYGHNKWVHEHEWIHDCFS